jgi:hypothetical protein
MTQKQHFFALTVLHCRMHCVLKCAHPLFVRNIPNCDGNNSAAFLRITVNRDDSIDFAYSGSCLPNPFA